MPVLCLEAALLVVRGRPRACASDAVARCTQERPQECGRPQGEERASTRRRGRTAGGGAVAGAADAAHRRRHAQPTLPCKLCRRAGG
eukprot:365754-Chlamydomonas_euryale.AAC.10